MRCRRDCCRDLMGLAVWQSTTAFTVFVVSTVATAAACSITHLFQNNLNCTDDVYHSSFLQLEITRGSHDRVHCTQRDTSHRIGRTGKCERSFPAAQIWHHVRRFRRRSDALARGRHCEHRRRLSLGHARWRGCRAAYRALHPVRTWYLACHERCRSVHARKRDECGDGQHVRWVPRPEELMFSPHALCGHTGPVRVRQASQRTRQIHGRDQFQCLMHAVSTLGGRQRVQRGLSVCECVHAISAGWISRQELVALGTGVHIWR
jgi:hypothetical protein